MNRTGESSCSRSVLESADESTVGMMCRATGAVETFEGGALQFEHLAIEVHKGAERPVLGRGRHATSQREVEKKLRHLRAPTSRGWQRRWNCTNSRVQRTYASSVRGESCRGRRVV